MFYFSISQTLPKSKPSHSYNPLPLSQYTINIGLNTINPPSIRILQPGILDINTIQKRSQILILNDSSLLNPSAYL